MTIDETINKYIKLKIFAEGTDDKRAKEEYEQLVELLEELKANKVASAEVYEQGYKRGYKNGFNKAIDDFTEKLTSKCDGMIKDKWNSNVAHVSWAEAYADFKDDIEEIAERLKEGGENE